MEKKTLARILDAADGISRTKDSYEVAEAHRVSFYIGNPGQAMEISEVTYCVIEEDYLAIHTGSRKAWVYVSIDSVSAVVVRPAPDDGARRPGFS